MQIRQGAAALIVRAPGDNSAMSMKYEGTFVRAARQCRVVAGQMIMKVGVEGRIVLGPAGAPGEVNVPLRIAIVDQNPTSTKTILTKLIEIPVSISSVYDNPTFTHIEDNLSFPLPSPTAKLDHYLVYIGFDPLGAKMQRRPPRWRPRRRRIVKPLALSR
jgi:hypothetical protein